MPATTYPINEPDETMKIGDRVKIVNYGHMIMFSKNKANPYRDSMAKTFPLIFEDDTSSYYDIRPELIGKEGIVVNKITDNHSGRYSVHFDDGNRMSWFSERQIEKI